MNKSPESPILSDEHYKFLQLDQIKRGVSSAQAKSPVAAPTAQSEEKSLREFNAELLQRIGEYRKKNLEFSASENALKTELAAQAKKFADRERELNQKFQKEFEQLKKSAEDDRIETEQSVEEWNRKLAKLSDEAWAKGLEADSLRRSESENQERIERLQEQMARAQASEAAQRGELEAALESEEKLRVEIEAVKAQSEKDKKAALEAQLSMKSQLETSQANEQQLKRELVEGAQLLAELQNSLERQAQEANAASALSGQQHMQLVENFKHRESQLITAFEALRTEYSNIDNCYREANETIAQIRAELQRREETHQQNLAEQEKYLRSSYLTESQDIIAENAKLREMLSVRDTRFDADRAALQTWREQLGYLDQHLKQQTDALKKDKADTVRMVRAVSEEVQFSLAHPFTEYLEIAEKEVAHIESQLANTSSMAPLRAKLATRLQHAQSHRDGIIEILDQAKNGLTEHSKTIQNLLKNLEALSL